MRLVAARHIWVWYAVYVEKTTVYLPTELKLELRLLAKRSRQSEASLIREAVQGFVSQKSLPRPVPRTFGIVADGSIDAAEDEAYLAENWKPDW